MLDQNLPTFFFKASNSSIKHDTTVYLSQHGGDAAPIYNLRHLDPASPGSRNRYAAALCDSYQPEVVFAEVLLTPEWSQPSLSAEETRLNNGVTPPAQPILPTEFTIQLYNPDQQIIVRQHAGSWNSAASWEFEMPQKTFRIPSTSALDRIQSDPTASDITPKITFRWKRESKLSKELICNLAGKSTNPDGSKRKHKDPDIPIAFLRHLREVTVYEPNLSRVEMEDAKGLEVVLILGAAVIKDVYFGSIRETFGIVQPPRQKTPTSPPALESAFVPPAPSPALPIRQQKPKAHAQHSKPSSSPPRPVLHVQTDARSSNHRPPSSQRSERQIEAETARLRKLVEEEERTKQKAEHDDAKRMRRMLDEEKRAARRRQAEVDRETERLRKEYDVEQRRHGAKRPTSGGPQPRTRRHDANPPHHAPYGIPARHQHPQQSQPPQFYGQPAALQPPFAPTNGPNGFLQAPGASPGKAIKPKRSTFFGLLGTSSEGDTRLLKKQSAIF